MRRFSASGRRVEPVMRIDCDRPLALKDMHRNARLQIRRRRKDFGTLDRDWRVAGDQRGRDIAQGLDAERQRRHVNENDVPYLPSQHTRLNSGSLRHAFHRVDTRFCLLTDQLLKESAHARHARRTTDKDQPVDLAELQARIVEGLDDRLAAPLDDRTHEAFELGSRELVVEVGRRGGGRGEKWQVDSRGGGIGELDFRDLCSLAHPRQRTAIIANVNARLALKRAGEMLDKNAVHVGAAELGVAARRLDLEDPLAEFHDRDVQCPAAEVDDGNTQLLAELIELVGERGGGRLVDEPGRLEARYAARILGRAALVIVEVGRHRDDRLIDRLTKKRLGIALDLLQGQRGQLLRGELLANEADLVALAYQALEPGDRALRVDGLLPSRRLANNDFAIPGDRDITGKGFAAECDPLGAWNDDRTPAPQNGGR